MLPGYREFGELQPPRTILRRIADWWKWHKVEVYMAFSIAAIIGAFIFVATCGTRHCPNCDDICNLQDNYCKNCGQNLRPTTPNN